MAVVAGASLPLTLERFAEISAELDVGAPRDEVLATAGLSPKEWLDTQQYWLSQIGADALRKRYELAERYNAAFLAARKLAFARRMKRRRTPDDVPVAEIVAPSQSSPAPLPQVVEVPLAGGLGAVATSGPRLELAQWAALCAEIAVHADRAHDILARYGFDEGAYDRERDAWQHRFAEAPASFQEYMARFRHYRDWFLGAGAR